MEKIYIVTFNTQKNRIYEDICYLCYAKNAKDAVAKVREIWTANYSAHPFHLHAVKSNVQEVEKLSIRNWIGSEITGEDCMDAFYCTDFRNVTWGAR